MRMKFHNSALLTASVLLAACSGVGDYKGPQDMDATDMTVASEDMPEKTSDMSTTPQDMGTTSGEDMPDTPNTPAPPALTAKGTTAGVELAWSPVPDALRYEVRIDGGDWINVLGELTYLDEEAPVGAITSATVSASDATRREAVDLTIEDLQTEEGSQRTYEVRAITADATTEPSNQESASRITEITGYQWQYTDSLENPDWRDIDGATTESAEDPGARGNGNARHYRVEISTNAPEPILSETDAGFRLAAIQVHVGGLFSCALLNNKKVRCWGTNTEGQLGHGTTQNVGISPGDMPPPYTDAGGPVKSLAVGNKRVCVHLEDNSVRCWGQLYGNTTFDPIGDEPGEMPPPAIDIGGTVKSLSTIGVSHQCAIMQDDQLKCWGFNKEGQLGVGDTRTRGLVVSDFPLDNTPMGGSVLKLTHPLSATCALMSDFSVKCWGLLNYLGAALTDTMLGDEPNEMPPIELPVAPEGWRVTDFSDGFGAGAVCVIAEYIENNTQGVFCWGQNFSGQLGTGDTENLGDDPGELPGKRVNQLGKQIKKVYAGGFGTCLLASDERAYCWGSGGSERPAMGPDFAEAHGDEPGETAPKQLDLGGSIQQLSLGLFHSCALMSDGEVKCWGYNDNGELGIDSTETIGADMTTWPPPNVKLY